MNRPTLKLAFSATLHCLTGCAIGEIIGLIIGTMVGLDNLTTIVISIALAFIFGYSLSLLPLVKIMSFTSAAMLVLAADTLSITTMEIIDNSVMAVIPGAMGAGLVNPLFWAAMAVSMIAAFIAAFPVNYYLLRRGRGHALIHQHH